MRSIGIAALSVALAKAGAQGPDDVQPPLDPRFRGDDGVAPFERSALVL